MPDIQILELEHDFVKILVSGVTPEFMNGLRRTIMADVPKMAIHDVEFQLGSVRDKDKAYESKTPLFDEVLAHRLAMLPIPTDLESFNFREECSCRKSQEDIDDDLPLTEYGCPNCTITYAVNKKGPCIVYSGDLEPIGSNEFRIKPDLIPLVELNEGQALLVYANAILGRGKDHAKWQAGYAVGYKYYPVIDYDPKKCKKCGKCYELCPKNIFEKGKKDKAALIQDRMEECILCMSCVESCEEAEADAINVKGDDTKFIFHFETDGAISAKDVLLKTLNILQEKYSNMRTGISEAL